METTGDHQMQHQPELVLETEGDPLPHAAYFPSRFAKSRLQGRGRRANEEGPADLNSVQTSPDDALAQSFHVNGDIGELGHDGSAGSF